MKKILFVSSSGGHFSELYKIKDVAKDFKKTLIVEKTPNFKTDFCDKQYFVKEINRKENFFIIKFIFLFLKELFIFLKERPDYVITTGALCAYPISKIAKFFRKKIIYIESYARVYDLSMTGKKMYKFADLFLVQWLELVKKYPKAKYSGDVFGGFLE